jgi:hypothetical protein
MVMVFAPAPVLTVTIEQQADAVEVRLPTLQGPLTAARATR